MDLETNKKHNDCTLSKADCNPNLEYSIKNPSKWFKNSLFYHIWIPSFFDSNNDGWGDINGITDKISYIKSLSCNALWLSPFFDCGYKGKNMHGYDVTDFYSINPILGNIEDLKKLLKTAHDAGIRVIFDLPMNHTSHKHPWFINSKNNISHRDWYIWHDNPGEGWNIIWNEDRAKLTWHKHEKTNFYGVFSEYMPDLNFTNKEVRDEMQNIITFWLNFGFDGVRIDGVRYIYEDGPHKISDAERTHILYKNIRSNIFDSYDAIGYSKLLIAEAWGEKEIIKEYYGDKNEFHSCFNFPITRMISDLINNKPKTAALFNSTIKYQLKEYPDQYLGGIFLTNHDLAGNRPATDFKHEQKKMILALAIQIFLPGTPFIYYGNELGMANAEIQGDMKVRGKMDWDLVNDENQILYEYRVLLSLYQRYFAKIENEEVTWFPIKNDMLSFIRKFGVSSLYCIFNCSDKLTTISFDSKIYKDYRSFLNIESRNKIYITESSVYTIDLPAYSHLLLLFE